MKMKSTQTDLSFLPTDTLLSLNHASEPSIATRQSIIFMASGGRRDERFWRSNPITLRRVLTSQMSWPQAWSTASMVERWCFRPPNRLESGEQRGGRYGCVRAEVQEGTSSVIRCLVCASRMDVYEYMWKDWGMWDKMFNAKLIVRRTVY